MKLLLDYFMKFQKFWTINSVLTRANEFKSPLIQFLFVLMELSIFCIFLKTYSTFVV